MVASFLSYQWCLQAFSKLSHHRLSVSLHPISLLSVRMFRFCDAVPCRTPVQNYRDNDTFFHQVILIIIELHKLFDTFSVVCSVFVRSFVVILFGCLRWFCSVVCRNSVRLFVAFCSLIFASTSLPKRLAKIRKEITFEGKNPCPSDQDGLGCWGRGISHPH